MTKNNKEQEDFIILESAYNEILRTVAKRIPESGGILLGSRKDFVVQKFVFDPNGSMSSAAYDPDTVYLNKVVKSEWAENKLEFLGFLHSHPRGVSRLSGDWGGNTGDVAYMKAIFRAMPSLKKFLVPIMYTLADGGDLKIFPYMAYRDNEENYEEGSLVILRDSAYENLGGENGRKVQDAEHNNQKGQNAEQSTIAKNPKKKEEEEFVFYSGRLEGAIDYQLLKAAKIACIGVGGANGICESLVRSGLGTIVLLDFDIVDNTNLSTQGFYVNDIGRLKVDALKDRLLNINPNLKVITIAKNFLELNDKDESDIFQELDLLLMMTDDFHAQALGNKMGLKYQVATIFAIMYERARGSEITFMIPGVTPACHRCAVSSRYQAYDDGYKNIVTSAGSTNFHTQYLNASIGLLALAILHRNTSGFEFSNWFGDKWERNLIQLRTSPFYESRLFARTLGTVEQAFCFDSVWQKIEVEAPPEYEPCPDCGGVGDLTLVSVSI
jgi:molybdopterin/thiamine biosynthesis adenylyltransferase